MLSRRAHHGHCICLTFDASTKTKGPIFGALSPREARCKFLLRRLRAGSAGASCTCAGSSRIASVAGAAATHVRGLAFALAATSVGNHVNVGYVESFLVAGRSSGRLGHASVSALFPSAFHRNFMADVRRNVLPSQGDFLAFFGFEDVLAALRLHTTLQLLFALVVRRVARRLVSLTRRRVLIRLAHSRLLLAAGPVHARGRLLRSLAAAAGRHLRQSGCRAQCAREYN